MLALWELRTTALYGNFSYNYSPIIDFSKRNSSRFFLSASTTPIINRPARQERSERTSPISFLALPVIPELKITDKGLVDVKQFCIVPLFAD